MDHGPRDFNAAVGAADRLDPGNALSHLMEDVQNCSRNACRSDDLMTRAVTLSSAPRRWSASLPVAAAAVVLFLAGALACGAARAEGEAIKVLAFGDSLTHGYGLADGATFPQQLEAALAARGHAVTVINGGNSGDTTAAGRARLDWALADNPDAVLIELGANDGLRGIEPSVTYENLDAILTRLRDERLPVLLTGMRAPRSMGEDYTREFDAVFPRLAAKHDVPLYPFFLEGVAAEASLNQADGIHPNAAGVAIIVEGIMPYVLELIGETGTASRGDG